MASAAAALVARLRAPAAADRVAAAQRLVALTDMSSLPSAAEEHGAVEMHGAAGALAAGGACAPLAAMLRPDASGAEQQAACSALRCLFNVLNFLADNGEHVTHGERWAHVLERITLPGAPRRRATLPVVVFPQGGTVSEAPCAHRGTTQRRRSCTTAAARRACLRLWVARERRLRRETQRARCASCIWQPAGRRTWSAA
jgi:hypothetical protein